MIYYSLMSLFYPILYLLLGGSIFSLGPWYITSSLIVISFLLLIVSQTCCFHHFIISRWYLIKLLSLSLQMDILGQETTFIPQLLYRTSLPCFSFVCFLLTFQHFKCMSYFLPSTDFLGFPLVIFFNSQYSVLSAYSTF